MIKQICHCSEAVLPSGLCMVTIGKKEILTGHVWKGCTSPNKTFLKFPHHCNKLAAWTANLGYWSVCLSLAMPLFDNSTQPHQIVWGAFKKYCNTILCLPGAVYSYLFDKPSTEKAFTIVKWHPNFLHTQTFIACFPGADLRHCQCIAYAAQHRPLPLIGNAFLNLHHLM